jgi:hypothetical protein
MAELPPGWRHPYVGQGAEGCERSAQIDREEAATLDQDDPRVEALRASAERWDLQAAWMASRPTWSPRRTSH